MSESDQKTTTERRAELLAKIRQRAFNDLSRTLHLPVVRSVIKNSEIVGEVWEKTKDAPEEADLAQNGGGVFFSIVSMVKRAARRVYWRDDQRLRRDKSVSLDEGNDELIECLPDRSLPTLEGESTSRPTEAAIQQREERNALLAVLTQNEKRIWELSEQSYSETEIAEILEVSQQRVSKIKTAIKSKLRQRVD